MRNLRIVKVAKVRTPFMIAVPQAITGTKRIRRYFKEHEAALAYVISVKQRGFFAAEGGGDQAPAGKVTLAEAAALWLARHDEQRPSFFQVRKVIGRLIDRHGRDPIDTVTHREIDTWIRSLEKEGFSPVTVHNYWRVARRFFNYARDFLEVIPRNPFSKLKEHRLEHKDPEILTPEQMRSCLEAAAGDKKLLAYLTLGGFAGLRTAEILRQRWEDIDWHGGEIYVRQPKKVAAWRPRHVEILPALRRHLERVALNEGQVFQGGMRELFLLRRSMMDKLGMSRWLNNCLRHSFRTYHSAHFQNLAKTSLQMGHTTVAMTFYRYGASTLRVTASSWWEL